MYENDPFYTQRMCSCRVCVRDRARVASRIALVTSRLKEEVTNWTIVIMLFAALPIVWIKSKFIKKYEKHS